MTDLAQIERQRRWELEGVTRGVQRYYEAEAEADAADTEPGKRMMKDIMRNLIPTIEAAQEEAQQALADAKGRWSLWWVPILCLEADKIALITARAAINTPSSRQKNAADTATHVAMMVARSVKLQREFDLWKEAEAAKEKEARKEGTPAINLYKVMVSRVTKIDARTARKWMQKADEIDRLDWTQEVMVAFGMKMLGLLVEHGGGYFEVTLLGEGSDRRRTTTRYVTLTPTAQAFICDVNEQSGLDRPWLMPMLCPPMPWSKA